MITYILTYSRNITPNNLQHPFIYIYIYIMTLDNTKRDYEYKNMV